MLDKKTVLITGAGGNVGGMLFGFLFKSKSITYLEAFAYIGIIAIGVSFIVLLTRFAIVKKTEEITPALKPVLT